MFTYSTLTKYYYDNIATNTCARIATINAIICRKNCEHLRAERIAYGNQAPTQRMNRKPSGTSQESSNDSTANGPKAYDD